MLQFWKKTGQNKSCSKLSNKLPEKNESIQQTEHRLSCEVKPKLSNLLASFDDEGLSDIDEIDSTKERSTLSKTLQEVLFDKNALTYFTQYMESRNASPYILCWLDIESFKTDMCINNASSKEQNTTPVTFSKSDHDSLSVSTDCDSFTGDSNSLCECSAATLAEVKKFQDVNEVCDNSDSSCNLKVKTDEPSEKGTENALIIFKKYVALEASLNIHCSDKIRNDVMENICNTDKVLSGCCFDSLQEHIYEVMDKEYFNAFLGTDYFCKHQIDVLTSGNVILDDILYNETALFYFMEYLEQENQTNLLEFWIAATNLQQQLHNQKDFFDPVEAQNDAVVLYDKYFSLQAHCPLGFSDKVRFAVEQNICGENGLILECFHLPLKIVEQVLSKNYLKPFLGSQLFYKYLSELINTVQANGYSTSTIEKNKYASSDCSSERSFSTSTFLALELPNTVKRRETTGSMTIDTRELCDPDALWKRKRYHRLSLGRVTELGKYVADFEPEPDKKEFKFKDVMKKIVSLDEDEKRKEEMAWQVAEMIVKDITNVTLNENKL